MARLWLSLRLLFGALQATKTRLARLLILEVSLIVPTRNRPQLLHRALASVCPLVKSIYVVDDGSSKAVKAELEVISRFDSRVKLILNDTWQGAAHCRNQGASHAKTNWLLFLDDDDQVSQGYLAVMRPLVAAHPLVQVWIPNFQKEKVRRTRVCQF